MTSHETSIGRSTEAASALSDYLRDRAPRSSIDDLRSRRSLMLIMWGALTFAGYLLSYLSPRHAGYGWIAVYVAGIAGIDRASARSTGRDPASAASISGCSRPSCCSSRSESSPASGSVISRRARWERSGRSISCCSTPSPDCGSGRAFVAIGLGIIALTLDRLFLRRRCVRPVDGLRQWRRADRWAASGCAGAERWPSSTISSTSRCG